ncbi:MAG: hypothetical protein ACOYNL_10350 [Rickettsiales bacterium]
MAHSNKEKLSRTGITLSPSAIEKCQNDRRTQRKMISIIYDGLCDNDWFARRRYEHKVALSDADASVAFTSSFPLNICNAFCMKAQQEPKHYLLWYQRHKERNLPHGQESGTPILLTIAYHSLSALQDILASDPQNLNQAAWGNEKGAMIEIRHTSSSDFDCQRIANGTSLLDIVLVRAPRSTANVKFSDKTRDKFRGLIDQFVKDGAIITDANLDSIRQLERVGTLSGACTRIEARRTLVQQILSSEDRKCGITAQDMLDLYGEQQLNNIFKAAESNPSLNQQLHKLRPELPGWLSEALDVNYTLLAMQSIANIAERHTPTWLTKVTEYDQPNQGRGGRP